MKTRRPQRKAPQQERTPQPVQSPDPGSNQANMAAMLAMNEQADLEAGMRPLPNAANITGLTIDEGKVLDVCDGLSKKGLRQLAPGLGLLSGATAIKASDDSIANHPTLPDMISRVLGSAYFSGSRFWTSGFQDDGKNDLNTLGFGNVKMKVDLSAYVRDIDVVTEGAGAFNSSGSASAGATLSQTDSIGGSLGGSVGTGEGADTAASTSGEVSASQSTTEGSSFGSTGGMGVSVALPTTTKRCALILEATVHCQTPMVGPFSHTELVECGELVLTEVAS